MNATTTLPPIVQLKDVHVALGAKGAQRPVLAGLSLDVTPGSFTAIIGPSGCGKTTILNLLADVVAPTSGEVLLGSRPPRDAAAKAGYMLARDALLPWRSVHKNVELPLEILGEAGAAERRRTAQALIDRVGLHGHEHQRVKQLSHGMRQRVSLARLLAFDPDVLLMDEPFSALDAQTRMRAQEFFLEVWQRDRKTVLLVTHDIQEAIFMADEVLVFSARPATLVGRFPVDFPRPRTIETLRGDPRFTAMHDEIWGLLKTDVEY